MTMCKIGIMQKSDDCCKKGDDDVEINLAKCLSKSIITCPLDGVRSDVFSEQQEQSAFLQLLREFNDSKGKLFDPAVLDFFDRKRKEETSKVTIITTPWNRTESCTKVVIMGSK